MPRKPSKKKHGPREFLSTDDIVDDDEIVMGTPDLDGNVYLRRSAAKKPKDGVKRGKGKKPAG